jgi:hypothetical protein
MYPFHAAEVNGKFWTAHSSALRGLRLDKAAEMPILIITTPLPIPGSGVIQ